MKGRKEKKKSDARGPFGHVWIWIPYEGKLCVMWEHVECEILLVCGSYNDGLV